MKINENLVDVCLDIGVSFDIIFHVWSIFVVKKKCSHCQKIRFLYLNIHILALQSNSTRVNVKVLLRRKFSGVGFLIKNVRSQ